MALAAFLTVKPGQDLSGNTFWEFKDQINHNRWRRIVKADRRTALSDVQISPQWHQWLRQTRIDPPTLQEQAFDLQRQAALKQNARLADARWAAKAKYIEKPKPATQTPHLSGSNVQQQQQPSGTAPARQQQQPRPQPLKSAVDNTAAPKDPWAKADETAINPGSNWQPEAWTPPATKR
jgi:NADH dehydrogenase [ubiquinone] 1 alpha subcomplex assembly factor 2